MDKNLIIAAIEAHSKKTGLACATVTSRAVNNSRLYLRMKRGGDCTTDVGNRIFAFIAADKPKVGAS